MTAQWLDQSNPGRGLGLIVGPLDERPGLDVYVANDMTANQLWSSDQSGNFRMVDLASIRGVANSGRSFSQASMGMSAADPDQDGDIDFFLTHFAEDHNTYYEQVHPGLWADRTIQVGLAKPSMNLLGFGTEWVDFDNNGTLELVVSNGHVDDVDRKDIQYQMPPQMFRRQPDGRWQELDRATLGTYFDRNHLGRALATLDANRDGRCDVVITHLYTPVSLLINESKTKSSSLGIMLKSRKGSRDAVGSTIRYQVGNQSFTTSLMTGDGYMCANQRRIHVGTGDYAAITNLTIQWPTGESQEVGTLDSGGDYVIVQGDSPHRLFQHQNEAKP